MFGKVLQPGIVSLFSSTGSNPLQLFSIHKDVSLPADSIIHIFNDASSTPAPPPPAVIIHPPPLNREAENEDWTGHSVDQDVLHIQSPTLTTTYIRCPPGNVTQRHPIELGMKHHWMYIQVRNLGREWSFEIGLVDKSGRQGIVRCSTFQKQPSLKLSTTPPLLHLPLAFPSSSSQRLTAWSTVALHLPPLLSQFNSPILRELASSNDEDNPGPVSVVPTGGYSHLSYIKVYATCRLRRIWFSEGRSDQKLPWELQLYGS